MLYHGSSMEALRLKRYFEYFDPYDQYAACWIALRPVMILFVINL